MKLTHTKTQTPLHSESPASTHTLTQWIAPTLITSADRNPPPPPSPPQIIYIYINHNNNSQPGAEASFSISVNKSNEPDILLSLWPSKRIQSGQISVHTKSVSAHSSPYVHFGGVVELCSQLWLVVLCNSKINERGLLADILWHNW